jgi:hypothetical protein
VGGEVEQESEGGQWVGRGFSGLQDRKLFVNKECTG